MRYKTYCFGDLVEKWIDNRGKTPPLSENGIPLLEVKHLPESNLYPKIVGTKFVDKETYDSWFRAYLEPNDILFSTVGTTARVVMTPPTETVAIAQNILGIRFKKDLVDPWFMFYYMRGKQFQHDIEARLVTTVQASIKRADMVGIPIAVPQLDAQKELVHRVISLDHKIQLNQDINQTLEQMAQALFKSWFVDFEPVKAKMAVLESGGSQADAMLAAMTAISGKDADALAVFEREHPEQYAELKATAELFPSAMQDSELGDIPEGWYLQRFSNIATLHYGKALKKTERIEGPYSVYGSGGITGSHNSYLVEGPGIIVGRKGSIGTLYWEDGKFHPIDTVYYVENKEGVPLTYLYYLMGTLNLSSMNTDAAVPGLNRDNVYRLETINPEIAILNEFNNHVSALRNMIQRNKSSTETLTQLRDTLLPKLLSGEITLPDAEQAVSEVANV